MGGEEMATDSDSELSVMVEVQRLLTGLDPEAARRVARWVADKHGVVVGERLPGKAAGESRGDNGNAGGLEDLASLYEKANPSSTRERVMTVAYWFQVAQGQLDVDSQSVNTELKQLGHGLKNVTKAFTELIQERPQLAIQVRKAGSTRQARKRYRLTAEGIKRVRALLEGASIHE
jgi:hypothetical protein